MEGSILKAKKYAIGLVINTNNRGDLNKVRNIAKNLNALYDVAYSYIDSEGKRQYTRYKLVDVPEDIELYVFLTVGPLVHPEIRTEIAKNVEGQAWIENQYDVWIDPGTDRTETQMREQIMNQMRERSMEMYWMINLNTGVGGNILDKFQPVIYG